MLIPNLSACDRFETLAAAIVQSPNKVPVSGDECCRLSLEPYAATRVPRSSRHRSGLTACGARAVAGKIRLFHPTNSSVDGERFCPHSRSNGLSIPATFPTRRQITEEKIIMKAIVVTDQAA